MPDRIDHDADELDQILDRLAGNIDELTTAVSPAGLAARAKESVLSRFVDETGAVRTDVVVKIAGGAVGVLVAAVVIRRVLR